MVEKRRVPPESGAPLTEEDAIYGAAYRVIFERLGNWQNCTTAEQLVAVSASVAAIREWSRSQESGVARAYERAAVLYLGEARKMVENTQRAQRMQALYATIPRPPA